MKNAQKPDHISLGTLISRLGEGRYVIPDFQRDFEWKPWDIRELLRSVFHDYYIGSLLLWKGKPENFLALSCENVYGYGGSETSPEHIVLDGQQRLTALHYAFHAPDIPAPSRSNRFLFFLRVDRFMDEDGGEAFEYDWTRRGVKLLADPERQYKDHMFPMAIMGRKGWDLPNWVQGYVQYWKERAADDGLSEHERAEALGSSERGSQFGELLKGLVQEYQVAFIELDKDLGLEKVCDIFTQINSRGIRLDVFDLLNALLRPRNIQLKHLWKEAASRLEFVESEKMNVYVLQVMSILRQAYCSPKYLYYLIPGQKRRIRTESGELRDEVLVGNIGEFERMWASAVDALVRAVEHLRHPQEFGVTSSRYLPYISMLPAFAALLAAANELPPERKLKAGRKIRHWYWASVFSNRYSGSVESTSSKDFLDVKTWFDDDQASPSLIAEFRHRFRRIDLQREVKRGSSVYNGLFNLLVINGARDWMTGNVPHHGELDDHHIVPKKWGKQNGVGSLIDSILNRTPLTADTNRNVIRERLPNSYLPWLIAENGEKKVREILESHFISPHAQAVLMRDPFTRADFEEFLDERQRTLKDAIENLLIKERQDLPPQLRDLDAEVEDVEISLRSLISNGLDDDPTVIPPHLQPKVQGRIEALLKKNPGRDRRDFETLAGQLPFCDLRELEPILTSREAWAIFEGVFGSKEQLKNRFNQIAELRNGIRHSRGVDDIAQKDGEAAIGWFKRAFRSHLESDAPEPQV